MKRGFVRKLSALLAVVIVVPTLVACSSPSNECLFPSGDASSVVTAEGAIGSEPQIDMPTPVVAQRTEVSIVTEGEGKPLSDGQPARVDISIINGATGEVLEDTGYAGGVLFAAGSEALPPVTEALECASVGSRLVVVGTAEETHNGEPLPQLGVEANDSLVFVVDVLDSFLPRADGTQRASENGNPAVVLAPNGQPGVTIPNTEPPAELIDTLLKEGGGDTVEEGDQVVVHYTGFTWADSEVFDTTWDSEQPRIFQLTEDSGLIEGFLTGLIDKKVGSQVLLVIPPGLGYGEQGTESIPGGSTLVFVVDILGIAE
jgi:hypothetical protein